MILAFMTKWVKDMPPLMAGKPTYFVEKISHSIKEVLKDHIPAHFCPEGYDFLKQMEVKPKYHTIRTDEKDRWKAGNDIHFFINARTKEMFQFAPVIKCVSTQRIEIIKVARVYTPYTYKTKANQTFQIVVDGNSINRDRMEQLAFNDGFDSLEDFFAYFNTDLTGKIIHWTPLKY